jgi:hypothetical protein
MKLTEDNFDETPIQNHLDEDATFDGTMYETYGAELDFVFSVSQAENTNKTVWTILELMVICIVVRVFIWLIVLVISLPKTLGNR